MRRGRKVKAGFRRHLEGWELGLISVAIAALGVALLAPRAAEPDVVPLPRIDRKEVARTAALERQRAAAAVEETLPYEVRAVGEALRQYGRAEAAGESARAAVLRDDLRRAARAAFAERGAEALLGLRAVQTLMFLHALERWEHGSGETDELRELAGNLLQRAETAGWLRDSRQLDMSRAERSLLFRMRWGELTGLASETTFAPTANEWRLYYRFLLLHPERDGSPDAALRYAAAAAKYDPDYPLELALGILELRLGRPVRAAAALSAFLTKKPHGRWRLRAQNHLARALAESGSGAPP